MIYLSHFSFPDGEAEFDFRRAEKRTCFDTFYPFHVLSERGLKEMDMAPVTILYGGNGSGKTTALNVIGEKLGLSRETLYNRSSFFEDYLALCQYEIRRPVPENSRVITSDGVFDFMLDLRAINQGVDRQREEIFREYWDTTDPRQPAFRLRSIEDYEELKRVNLARKSTISRYARRRTPPNVREQSNGESAYGYFTRKIGENALYLLDEPENSLSPERQGELVQFLEESVRFFGCQFIIATHSPFLLSMREARIYDLDTVPAAVRPWTQLPGVRAYFDLFRRHRKDFENGAAEGDA